MPPEPQSIKEKRIRNITQLYYSRPDIQKIIFDFSNSREISPRYFEGFGKRPDTLQYQGDILAMAKKGATSFHCSEELWEDPLKLTTGLVEKQLNELRIGWDLLLDVDCKWFDYSKLAAKAIINVLKNHNIKNIGLKFSGSKGWHIIVPWKAFPKEIGGQPTKNLFPELPRKVINYLRTESRKEMEKILPEDFYEQFKGVDIKKGIKCNKCDEIAEEYILTDLFCPNCNIGEQRKLTKDDKKEFKCPNCPRKFIIKNSKEYFECNRCNINSNQGKHNFSQTIETDIFEVMGLDLILVSPRHLFRMPYSLHEKTSLASVVIDPEKVLDFQLPDANAMRAKPKEFMPNSEEGEAKELVMQAMDWDRETKISRGEQKEKITGKYADFKPIKLDNLSESSFPPCVQKILKGVKDGKKRSLFILINLFRSVGMDKEKLEKQIEDWNKKNEVPLKQGYIKSQLSWSYRKKPIMPQNCKEFYQGIGVCQPDDYCKRIKNPVNYTIGKQLRKNNMGKKKSRKRDY